MVIPPVGARSFLLAAGALETPTRGMVITPKAATSNVAFAVCCALCAVRSLGTATPASRGDAGFAVPCRSSVCMYVCMCIVGGTCTRAYTCAQACCGAMPELRRVADTTPHGVSAAAVIGSMASSCPCVWLCGDL